MAARHLEQLGPAGVRQRQLEARAARGAQRLVVVRVAAAGQQRHGVPAERARGAQQRAQVARVLHRLQRQQPVQRGAAWAGGGRRGGGVGAPGPGGAARAERAGAPAAQGEARPRRQAVRQRGGSPGAARRSAGCGRSSSATAVMLSGVSSPVSFLSTGGVTCSSAWCRSPAGAACPCGTMSVRACSSGWASARVFCVRAGGRVRAALLGHGHASPCQRAWEPAPGACVQQLHPCRARAVPFAGPHPAAP